MLELTPGMIHSSYIGYQVMLKPTGGRRKPLFIGWLYSETDNDFTLYMPEKTKRKYKDHPAIYQSAGYYKFHKDGTMFVDEKNNFLQDHFGHFAAKWSVTTESYSNDAAGIRAKWHLDEIETQLSIDKMIEARKMFESRLIPEGARILNIYES